MYSDRRSNFLPPPSHGAPRLKRDKDYNGNNLFFYAYYRYYYNMSRGIYDSSNRKAMVLFFIFGVLVYLYRSTSPADNNGEITAGKNGNYANTIQASSQEFLLNVDHSGKSLSRVALISRPNVTFAEEHDKDENVYNYQKSDNQRSNIVYMTSRNNSISSLGNLKTKLYLDRLLRVYVLPMEDQLTSMPEESTLYHYFLMGMYEHPAIQVVSEMEKADIYLHLVLYTNISIEAFDNFKENPEIYQRLVIIDENDYFDNVRHRIFDDGKYLAFFKRSFVQKTYSIPNFESNQVYRSYRNFKDHVHKELIWDIQDNINDQEENESGIEENREEEYSNIKEKILEERKEKKEKARIDFLRKFARPSLLTPGTENIEIGGHGSKHSTINERDLSFTYWPFQHSYFPFTMGVTDRYILGLWENKEKGYLSDSIQSVDNTKEAHIDIQEHMSVSSSSNQANVDGYNHKNGLLDIDNGENRDIDITCTLRAYHKPTFRGNREIVFNWLESYLQEEKDAMQKRKESMPPKEREIQDKKDSWNIWTDHNNRILKSVETTSNLENIENLGDNADEQNRSRSNNGKLRIILGEVDMWNVGNRDKNSPRYLSVLKRSKIIVTAGPGDWEGDFRMWESLASKALLFVDPIYTPVPFPFKDGEDLIVYDSTKEDEFWNKINYYLNNPREARRIAMNGYFKAIHYHRYVNRVDYVFNTVEMLLSTKGNQMIYEDIPLTQLRSNELGSQNQGLDLKDQDQLSDSDFSVREWLKASRYSATGMNLKELMMRTANAITVPLK